MSYKELSIDEETATGKLLHHRKSDERICSTCRCYDDGFCEKLKVKTWIDWTCVKHSYKGEGYDE